MNFKVGTLLAASLLSLTACGGSAKGVSAAKFAEEASKITVAHYAKATVSFSWTEKVTGGASLGGEDYDESGSGNAYLVGSFDAESGMEYWYYDDTKESDEEFEDLQYASILSMYMMVDLATLAPQFEASEAQLPEGVSITYGTNPFKVTQKQRQSEEKDGLKDSYSVELAVTWNNDGTVKELKSKISETVTGTYEGNSVNAKMVYTETITVSYSEPITDQIA